MRRLRVDLVLLLLLGLCPAQSFAADFRLVPSLGLAEDMSDNIFETPTNRKADLVTRVQPGLALNLARPTVTLDGLYNFDYRYYALRTRQDDISHTATVLGAASLLDDFFKVDLKDTYSRVSLDVARDNTQESLSQSQTDQNSLAISPYLLWRLGETTALKTGGRFSDIRYFSNAGIDKQAYGGFAELNHALTEKLGLTAGYNFTETEYQILSYQDHTVSAGFNWAYAEKSALHGSISNSWQTFSNGFSMSHLFWDAGISNDLGLAVATLETKSGYSEDPLAGSQRQTSYGARLDRVIERGSIGLSGSYVEYEANGPSLIAVAGSTSQNRKSITVAGVATRELSPGLTASINVTGDRLRGKSTLGTSSLDYPYHLNATVSMNMALAREASLGVSYTYATYRFAIDQANGSVEVNRLVLQFKKTF